MKSDDRKSFRTSELSSKIRELFDYLKSRKMREKILGK